MTREPSDRIAGVSLDGPPDQRRTSEGIEIPDFVTHYHPAEDPPFRNLGDASDDELPAILAGLAARRSSGSRRVFGRRYMAFRRRTETKLKALFEAAGGRPERSTPHYFVLGMSEWFAGLYSQTASVRIPISELASQTTSFTYPDSLVSMRFGADFGLPPDPPRPYHEKVFRLERLEEVIAEFGRPEDLSTSGSYSDYHRREFERYVEVQVWSDAPLAKWLTPARP